MANRHEDVYTRFVRMSYHDRIDYLLYLKNDSQRAKFMRYFDEEHMKDYLSTFNSTDVFLPQVGKFFTSTDSIKLVIDYLSEKKKARVLKHYLHLFTPEEIEHVARFEKASDYLRYMNKADGETKEKLTKVLLRRWVKMDIRPSTYVDIVLNNADLIREILHNVHKSEYAQSELNSLINLKSKTALCKILLSRKLPELDAQIINKLDYLTIKLLLTKKITDDREKINLLYCIKDKSIVRSLVSQNVVSPDTLGLKELKSYLGIDKKTESSELDFNLMKRLLMNDYINNKYNIDSIIGSAESLMEDKEFLSIIYSIDKKEDILKLIESHKFDKKIYDVLRCLASFECGKFNHNDVKRIYDIAMEKSEIFSNDPHLMEFLRDIVRENHKLGISDLNIKLLKSRKFKELDSLLCNKIGNQEVIRELYKSLDNDTDRLNIILGVKNTALSQELLGLNLLENQSEDFLKFLRMRIMGHKIVEDEDISKVNFDIDPYLTFGVELECVNENRVNYDRINNAGKILGRWKVVGDSSVGSNAGCGLEVVSPILTYNEYSLKELKGITDLLENYEFYTNDSCGGHIHFGYNYFDDLEFETFLQLYRRTEKYLYFMCNREGANIRLGVGRYAKPLGPSIEKFRESKPNATSRVEMQKYWGRMDHYNEDRYVGLNLTNISKPLKRTIEFRMPNGEINFNEINLNIRLFAKLIMASKRIANTRDIDFLEEYKDLYNPENSDEQNFEIFLDLLFGDNDKEKEQYRQRYYTNRENELANINEKREGLQNLLEYLSSETDTTIEYANLPKSEETSKSR